MQSKEVLGATCPLGTSRDDASPSRDQSGADTCDMPIPTYPPYSCVCSACVSASQCPPHPPHPPAAAAARPWGPTPSDSLAVHTHPCGPFSASSGPGATTASGPPNVLGELLLYSEFLTAYSHSARFRHIMSPLDVAVQALRSDVDADMSRVEAVQAICVDALDCFDARGVQTPREKRVRFDRRNLAREIDAARQNAAAK
eukprot:TRINITY_DN1088_c0_g1_i2.p2 TRINITY_DN1088_c0_g1~~TRINITY_DN1088_c0_g1_i2.p2  ORF type:complete len:200 (+),score=33.37 TRINITY_DN1088_c0_g1_i2:271-870(+)